MRTDPHLHYLDNAATTMVDPEVANVIARAVQTLWANPSSLYDPAVEAQQAIDTARARVAKTLRCRATKSTLPPAVPRATTWPCGARPSRGAPGAARSSSTGFEHPSVQLAARALRGEGFTVVEVPPEADGTLGHRQIPRPGRQKHRAGRLHGRQQRDRRRAGHRRAGRRRQGAQRPRALPRRRRAGLAAPAHRPAGLGRGGLAAVSGHKVHAPKGVGALFVRDSQRQTLCPPYRGGHQERGLRPGTENTPYIAGLGAAAAKGQQTLRVRARQMAELNARLRAGLAQLPGITVNSPQNAVPEVLNFSTGCVNSQTFINYLGTRGVYVSGGSACDKGEPSHTLQAMGWRRAHHPHGAARQLLRRQHARGRRRPAGRAARRAAGPAAYLKHHRKAAPYMKEIILAYQGEMTLKRPQPRQI